MGLKRTTNLIYIISLVVNYLKSYAIVKDDVVECSLAFWVVWSEDLKFDKYADSYEISLKTNFIPAIINMKNLWGLP